MTKTTSNPDTSVFYSSPLMKTVKTNSCYDSLSQVSFILFKQEQRLEIWLQSDTCRRFIKEYAVQLDNQSFGPRLYDNETTIPEGIYNFRPLSDSSFVTIDFPNEYDSIKTVTDKRPIQTSLISFKSSLEENAISLKKNDLKEFSNFLNHFSLNQTSLMILPSDIRETTQFPNCNHCPHWIFELYGQLKLSIIPFNH